MKKSSLEIIVWENEYWVIYDDNTNNARVVKTFPKSYSGRIDLLCFLMGYLGINLKIEKRFKELFKGGK
ncbi:MAG: hypothetical protein DRN03_05620 [Thermoplasmata archaeon]|nr:MAG: hypothetical protein DRN03_05620 [Thermoplasmata archaeon]